MNIFTYQSTRRFNLKPCDAGYECTLSVAGCSTYMHDYPFQDYL